VITQEATTTLSRSGISYRSAFSPAPALDTPASRVEHDLSARLQVKVVKKYEKQLN
jgi:hypothetical protein